MIYLMGNINKYFKDIGLKIFYENNDEKINFINNFFIYYIKIVSNFYYYYLLIIVSKFYAHVSNKWREHR